MAPALEQDFQNFSTPVRHFPFMAPSPALFNLNLAGFALASLRTKMCYKSLIFVYRKSISITAKQKY